MGALHSGHVSLLDLARKENDILISSLFVNPTQFNNPRDLEIYPRPLEKDLEILESHSVDFAFVPDVPEIYEHAEPWHMDLGNLEKVLEGEKRPGHFQGVSQIVKILFDLVKPNRAYFGQKDYQQYLVIQKLNEVFNLNIEIIACPIIREPDGLAMSSRNLHLSHEERSIAPLIYKALNSIQLNSETMALKECLIKARSILESSPLFIVEYLEIVDKNDLNTLIQWTGSNNEIALVAVRLGETRLIDNLIINRK